MNCKCRIEYADPNFKGPMGVPRIVYCPLHEAAPKLLEALTAVMDGFDRGVFVRNILGDEQPDWAMKLIPFVQTLGKAQAAIAEAMKGAESTE